MAWFLPECQARVDPISHSRSLIILQKVVHFIPDLAVHFYSGFYINQIEKIHLLILADFGLHPMDKITRLTLLQMLGDRYSKKSTLISSQLPVDKWYQYTGENIIADAIMDRLSYNAHRIELKGESLRGKKSK